ncbi:hypothetical protein Tco_1173565 [Tanacetum coccineum]
MLALECTTGTHDPSSSIGSGYKKLLKRGSCSKQLRADSPPPRKDPQMEILQDQAPEEQKYSLPPKGKDSAFAKPTDMIASSSSRNSSKNMPTFSSNDMVDKSHPREARKRQQERDRTQN